VWSVIVMAYANFKLPTNTQGLLEVLRPTIEFGHPVITEVLSEWEQIRGAEFFSELEFVLDCYRIELLILIICLSQIGSLTTTRRTSSTVSIRWDPSGRTTSSHSAIPWYQLLLSSYFEHNIQDLPILS
jgi:hypothetical protein